MLDKQWHPSPDKLTGSWGNLSGAWISSKGIFKPALFSAVESDSGFPLGTIRLGRSERCSRTQVQTNKKLPHQDPLEGVASVRSQANSGAVSLWWERDATSIGLNHKSYSAVHVAMCALNTGMWMRDQLPGVSWRMKRGLTWTSNKVCCLLDVWSDRSSFGNLHVFTLY